MKEAPLFSIITVVYNDADKLEETIKSIVNQDFLRFEYIVIDGGSVDKTPEIIEKYKSHISYSLSEKDKGIFDAMNKGINAAKGKYLNFLNAGDTFCTNKILELIADEIHRFPGTELLYGLAVRRSSETGSLKFIKGDRISTFSLFTSIPFCHQAIFYQRNLFEEVGLYDISFRVTADYQWLIRYYRLKKNLNSIRFLKKSLVEYLEGGFSFQNIHLAAKEKLRIAWLYFPPSFRPAGLLAFSGFYMKSKGIEWMVRFNFLERYRSLKYRLLNKTVS